VPGVAAYVLGLDLDQAAWPENSTARRGRRQAAVELARHPAAVSPRAGSSTQPRNGETPHASGVSQGSGGRTRTCDTRIMIPLL
jgi:hypothetical protein